MQFKKSLYRFLFIISIFIIAPTLKAQTPDGPNSTHEKWEFVLEDTGDILQIAIPTIAGLTTLIKKDWEGTKQFVFSYGTGFIVTHSLKRIIKKERPEGRNLFDAFPSGHTTSAFSGASFIHRRYGWKYGKWAYLGATIVGISRMEGPDGWHDHWDVLAGAIVGIGSTYLFTTKYQREHMEVGFSTNNNNYLLAFRFKF